jgi:hypothetical protein
MRAPPRCHSERSEESPARNPQHKRRRDRSEGGRLQQIERLSPDHRPAIDDGRRFDFRTVCLPPCDPINSAYWPSRAVSQCGTDTLVCAPQPKPPLLRVAIFNHAETQHRQECLCHIDPSIISRGRNVLRRPVRSKQSPDRRRLAKRPPFPNVTSSNRCPASPPACGRAARRIDSSMSLLTVVPSLAARSLSSSRRSSSIVIVVRITDQDRAAASVHQGKELGSRNRQQSIHRVALFCNHK